MPIIVPTTPQITVEGLAAHLNKTVPAEDSAERAELQMHLDSAVGIVEAACGPMAAREVTERVTPRSGRVLLKTWPVIDLVSATDADGVAVDLTGAEVDSAGEVTFETWPSSRVTLTVNAGREPVPAELVLATYIIAAHLWETQRGNDVRPGAFGAGEDDGGAVLMGFAIPRRASQLMAPHRALKVA